jgi:hypothetical protein
MCCLSACDFYGVLCRTALQNEPNTDDEFKENITKKNFGSFFLGRTSGEFQAVLKRVRMHTGGIFSTSYNNGKFSSTVFKE